MTDPVRRIADAVLYEGYILWPYRRSALKNQQRFTFGGIYPRGWPQDRSEIRAECLLEAPEPAAAVAVRFLQVVDRSVKGPDGEPLDELEVGGEVHIPWQEAVEREVVGSGLGERAEIAIEAGFEEESLQGDDGADAGTIVRSWGPLRGRIETAAERLAPGLHRLGVRVRNEAEWDGEPREEALHSTLCSTHVVLRSRGEFVSLTDPPAPLVEAAKGCRNEGVWPVLVGEPGDRSTVLCSPIILEDYPRIAPESPGDLFDGGEIDQLLTLSILSLSDAEKAEMRATDPRAREILERSEGLSEEQMMRLHGTVREFAERQR